MVMSSVKTRTKCYSNVVTTLVGGGGGSTEVAIVISVHPTNRSVTVGGAPTTFSVTLSAGTNPVYQWTRNGIPIAGATSSSYVLSGYTLADNGAVFAVVVSNAVSSVTSNGATLTVLAGNTAPTITSHPVAVPNATVGSTVSLTVVATGSAPLSYQWYRGTPGGSHTAMIDSAGISGSTTATLTLSNVQTPTTDTYYCVVTNPYGSATSNTAQVTVITVNVDIELTIAKPVSYSIYRSTPVVQVSAPAGFIFKRPSTYTTAGSPSGAVWNATPTSLSRWYDAPADANTVSNTSGRVSLLRHTTSGTPSTLVVTNSGFPIYTYSTQPTLHILVTQVTLVGATITVDLYKGGSKTRTLKVFDYSVPSSYAIPAGGLDITALLDSTEAPGFALAADLEVRVTFSDLFGTEAAGTIVASISVYDVYTSN